MAYKINKDVIFGDDVRVEGDLIIGHCIIGYPTREEVKTMINNQRHLKREIVETLPSTNIDPDTIYMIQKENTSSLTLTYWYGGYDDINNVWGPEAGALGTWIYCKVFSSVTYKINTTNIGAIKDYCQMTEKLLSGVPKTITVNENGEFTPTQDGYFMIGPRDIDTFNDITITSYLPDIYRDYMYINEEWVMVGDTSVDLSNYVTVEEIQNIN